MFSNGIYSDQFEIDEKQIVAQLDENEKGKIENVNQLEDLLRKSRQLNSSKSIRLINENLEKIPSKRKTSIEKFVFSCNRLGKDNQMIDSKSFPTHLQSLELPGNFIQTLDGMENNTNHLESLGLSFNDIEQFNFLPQWPNLVLLDLSYNLLDNLPTTIQLLKNLNQLRILFLHGNPLSLLMDYRIYVIDSLPKLLVFDDITITTEERFRSRKSAQSGEHPKDSSSFTITFRTIENLPNPPVTESEWPIRIHRYQMRLDWFDGHKSDVDIPFDKISNFHRFYPIDLKSSYSDYKTNLDFQPNSLNFSIKELIPFRDFLFHGTKCRFIEQITEYWPPGDSPLANDPKKKSNQNADAKDKKNEPTTAKKKKNEDLSKLVIRTDPIEKVLFEFFVDLRSLLDGDYQISHSFQTILQSENPIDQEQQQQQIKSSKKNLKKTNSIQEQQQQQRTSSSKSNKDKQKDKKNPIDEKSSESILIVEPTKCSIHFQLHRFVSNEEFI